MICRRKCALINTMENRAISLVESSRDNESSREVSPPVPGIAVLPLPACRGGLVSIPQCIAVLDHCIHIINSPAQLAQCSLAVV